MKYRTLFWFQQFIAMYCIIPTPSVIQLIYETATVWTLWQGNELEYLDTILQEFFTENTADTNISTDI